MRVIEEDEGGPQGFVFHKCLAGEGGTGRYRAHRAVKDCRGRRGDDVAWKAKEGGIVAKRGSLY